MKRKSSYIISSYILNWKKRSAGFKQLADPRFPSRVEYRYLYVWCVIWLLCSVLSVVIWFPAFSLPAGLTDCCVLAASFLYHFSLGGCGCHVNESLSRNWAAIALRLFLFVYDRAYPFLDSARCVGSTQVCFHLHTGRDGLGVIGLDWIELDWIELDLIWYSERRVKEWKKDCTAVFWFLL